MSLLPAVNFWAMIVTRRRQWLLIDERVTLIVLQYIWMSIPARQQCLGKSMYLTVSIFKVSNKCMKFRCRPPANV